MVLDLRNEQMKEESWQHWQAQGMPRVDFDEKWEWTIKHLENSQAMFDRGELTLTEDDDTNEIL